MPDLIIVSNRLPVRIEKSAGKLKVSPSSGGLATGLASYTKKAGTRWIGWPGIPSDDLSGHEQAEIIRKLKKYRCFPVFLSKTELDEFYNGFSNGVLWPALHELPIRAGDSRKNWQSYHRVNELFAEKTLALSRATSTIWVHDYQLLLLPQLLRAERPEATIGFFLHIPFPKPEKFVELEHGRALLTGMLGADLAGFHTKEYAKHFLTSCEKLGVGSRSGSQIILPNRAVDVTDFPMGIDYRKFASASKKRNVKKEYRKLEHKYAGNKVIVTVDRLDPTKGFIERLKAYRTVLKNEPGLRGKIVMVMLAIPSRGDILEYQKLKTNVEKLVQEINHEFGASGWQPIEYMFQTLPFEQLAALYQIADVAFVAPVRDGMNLVAKEYLASQPNQKGVLILSNTAGAAKELKDAVMVSPSRPQTLVSGLTKALNLPVHESRRRTGRMQSHLQQFTVQHWADSFIKSLEKPSLTRHTTRSADSQVRRKIISDFHKSDRRLILLDYDGTLREFETDPQAATPSKTVLKLLKKLCDDDKNDVMIISGRGRKDLGDWFGDLPITLAAEHGALLRRKGGKNWHTTSNSQPGWQDSVRRLFERYASRAPGAFVETKEWAVVWHYRAASPYSAQKNLVALRRMLKPICARFGLTILEGNKVLEVRPSDVSKRRAAQEWLIHDHSFILCIGDDATDEEMFAVLPPYAFSLKVGRGQTLARYRLKDVPAVLDLLARL